jgi:hypothetical protein
MASSLKGGGLLLWRAWQSIASLGMVLGIPHTALDNVQGAAGRVLTDAGLWPEPSTVRAVACSRLSSNATVCVEQNCVWCALPAVPSSQPRARVSPERGSCL